MSASTSHLIAPHGGELINLLASPEKAAELKAHSREWPSWDLTARQVCDLELLMSGGFSPLRGFMTKADYEGVCHNMRLASGVLWPMPITLDVTEEFAKKLTPGSSKVALRDAEGVMLAVLHVEEVWQPDREAEAKAVFNSTSKAHPGADYAMNKSNPWYVGGRVEGLQAPSALRLPHAALHSGGTARRVCPSRMAPGRRLPDPQSHAPRPRGTDVPRRQAGGSQPFDPSRRRNDQAWRRGLLHPRALLPVADFEVSAGHVRSSRCCLLPCAWADRAKRSGTR